jgi:hypothetical protein
MSRSLRVVQPKDIAFDMEDGLHFVRDMGEAVFAAASAISSNDPLRTVFEQLGQLISEKAQELQEQRVVVWRNCGRPIDSPAHAESTWCQMTSNSVCNITPTINRCDYESPNRENAFPDSTSHPCCLAYR